MSNELDTTSQSAMHWAEHFCAIVKENNIPIEPDFVVGWFANYWGAIYDPMQRKIEQQSLELQRVTNVDISPEAYELSAEALREVARDVRKAAYEIMPQVARGLEWHLDLIEHQQSELARLEAMVPRWMDSPKVGTGVWHVCKADLTTSPPRCLVIPLPLPAPPTQFNTLTKDKTHDREI
jgi:hypothetical protein